MPGSDPYVRRVRGVVTRWGTRGYGFLKSPELPRDAWCHVRFIADPAIDVLRPLPAGMELEFEPREIAGGQFQAHTVTRPGVAPFVFSTTAPELRSPMRGLEQLSTLRLQPPPVGVERLPEIVHDVAADAGVAARVGGERRRLEAERARLDSEVQALQRRADSLDAQIPSIERSFEEQIESLVRERERQVAELRGQAARLRRDSEVIRERIEVLPSPAAESRRILANALAEGRTRFKAWLSERSRADREVVDARRAAVSERGEPAVAEYEELRRRRNSSVGIERRAFELAEAACRSSMAAYADALDRLGSEPAKLAVLVMFSESDERLTLVGPVEPGGSGGEMAWRVRAFLADSAERGAQEMNAAVATGQLAGCFAVELRPWSAEPDLVEVALREAWEERPTLSSMLSLTCEFLNAIDATAESDPESAEATSGPESSGGRTVAAVASRFGMSVPDLVAALRGSGLPFPDDHVDEDVETTLQRLLGAADASAGLPATVAVGSPAMLDRSSPPFLARRIVEKLLRDRRVGARHTNMANAWAHHFGDDEKESARELTHRLVRRGLLLSKPKPDGDHISINPRRISEVHSLIDLRFPDPTLFDSL